jgi:hypothetical protein
VLSFWALPAHYVSPRTPATPSGVFTIIGRRARASVVCNWYHFDDFLRLLECERNGLIDLFNVLCESKTMQNEKGKPF